jgi:hypothetical protein
MISLMMIPNPCTIMPGKRTLYGYVEGGEYFIPFVYTTTTGVTALAAS